MKTIAICDDSKEERKKLKKIIMNYFEKKRTTCTILEYHSGEEILLAFEEKNVESAVAFLKIHLKGMNGMEVAHNLRDMNYQAPIIFLSDTLDYVLEGYEVQPSRYVLKPYEAQLIEKILDDFLDKTIKKRIYVRHHRHYRYVSIDDIVYIESEKHVLLIHLKDDQILHVVEKLGDIEKRIDAKNFIRCHQSYLVNMDYIKDIGNDFILYNDVEIPIRVRQRKRIYSQYHEYFMMNKKEVHNLIKK